MTSQIYAYIDINTNFPKLSFISPKAIQTRVSKSLAISIIQYTFVKAKGDYLRINPRTFKALGFAHISLSSLSRTTAFSYLKHHLRD